MRKRVNHLQRQSQKPKEQQIEILAEVFEELYFALEELQIANEDLQQQNEELSNTQQALVAQRHHYQELFEQVPDAYLVTDTKGVIQEANHAATTLLNISKSFLIGEPLDIYVVEEEHPNFHLKLSHLCDRSLQIQEWEANLRPRNRTPIIAMVKVTAICHQQNKLVGLRWLLRDITVIKRTEAQLRRAEEATRQAFLQERELHELKSRLLASTSHEFRTPLATILSSTELLEHYRHRWNDEQQLTHLHRIQKSVIQMSQLLDNLLMLNQDEAGKLEFNPTPLNLVEFCHELLKEVQQCDRSQHAIAFSSEYQSIEANFDPKLLRHILTNLLSNSLKYSPVGSTVIFSVTYPKNQVIFQIQDFGIGIPATEIEHIFEPFHRASNVGNVSGMGLGMSIVKKALDLHSGQITVESFVKVGTTCTVALPFSGNLHTHVCA
jgi:PAS domain S-box-containing protein